MEEIIKGNSEATTELKKLVKLVSKSNSTVLLRGEMMAKGCSCTSNSSFFRERG